MPICPLYTKLVLPLNQNLGVKSLFASLECGIDGRADRGLLCVVRTVVFPIVADFRLSLVKHNHVFCPPHLMFLSGFLRFSSSLKSNGRVGVSFPSVPLVSSRCRHPIQWNATARSRKQPAASGMAHAPGLYQILRLLHDKFTTIARSSRDRPSDEPCVAISSQEAHTPPSRPKSTPRVVRTAPRAAPMAGSTSSSRPLSLPGPEPTRGSLSPPAGRPLATGQGDQKLEMDLATCVGTPFLI